MKLIWTLAGAVLLMSVTGSVYSAQPQGSLPAASYDNLPRWRGFNLLEKFRAEHQAPFVEKDFQLIQKLGFNFVRLPMDYRCWISDGNWEQLNEAKLKEIDQAVEWGNKYGIHICINFHRAPGYTVAKPPEKLDLWTNAEAQRVCAMHWAAFARRYKGIPNARLSFNLFNEPAKIKVEEFLPVIKGIVAAIRREDPDRLIISDGIEWGKIPVLELAELKVAQATRGYAPGEISHYKASWVKSERFPEPMWPRPMHLPATLLSPKKPEGQNPITINGPFVKTTALRMRVEKVSSSATLVVEADGQAVLNKVFKAGPGEGEWKKSEYVEKYKLHTATYEKDYTVSIPASTKQVIIKNVDGDWIQLREFAFKPEGASVEHVLTTEAAFGKKFDPFRYAPGEPGGPFLGIPMKDRQWLIKEMIKPWQAAQAKGVGVIVGEWGCYNKTPHDVVLRWAEDNLANWKDAGWGWALWNFRGSFGILDSGRSDVKYEDFEGHKLDRKLLDLLMRY